MHPLGRYAVGAGIGLLILAIVWNPLIAVTEFLGISWSLIVLAIIVGAVLVILRVPSAQLNALVATVSGNPILKGIFTAALFTVIYGFCLQMLFGVVPDWVQGELGVERRFVWVLMTVLGLPLIPLLWLFYEATGIPGDPKVIKKAFRGLSFLMLLFFAWWYYEQPNRLFDVETGKAVFWVAEKEGKIYYFPGADDTTKKYFSPTTGEKLRRGNPEDAEKYRKESWVKKVGTLLPSFNRDIAPQRIVVVLKGEDVPSEPVYVATGSDVYFVGPPNVEIEDGRGKRFPLHGEHGVTWSPYRFYGPRGDTVFVDVIVAR